MNIEDFQKNLNKIIQFIQEYFDKIEEYPVKSQLLPGDIFNKIPNSAPIKSQSFDEIFSDFINIIIPGMTHWQSPNFFAYFPANNSYPSILGEILTATLGAQCMIWETSPAAAELEEKVMLWLREMLGLPKNFVGVIQDTASTSTLISILTAREKFSNFDINYNGFTNQKFRVYCSTEAHSSIEKAVKIAGIGAKNLVKIEVDKNFSMNPEKLHFVIQKDIEKGFTPLCVVAAFGTTGSTAVDPIKDIGKICKQYNIWFHIDAAYAGSALILPEYKFLLDGIEYADTFVFNPHKWLFTNFDCSAYFVKDPQALINTFSINPEYLKTNFDDHVNNYRDWGIALGRRFRALKLWFVIRSFGVEGLQKKLRKHLAITNKIKDQILQHPDFEILAPVNFNVICFRYKPKSLDEDSLNKLNNKLLNKINNSGRFYLTHTKLNNKFVIRFVIGTTNVEEKNALECWNFNCELAETLK